MKRELTILSAAILTASLLTSCGSDDEVGDQLGPYVGAWAYAGSDPDAGSRIYMRVDALAANERGYEIFPDGRLVVIHAEYIGGDFPTSVESTGIWSEEEGGDLLFSYLYDDWTRMLRVDILHVGEQEMECVETRLNW